jgi:hypothetical protein
MSYFDMTLESVNSIGGLTGVGGPFEPAPFTSPTQSLNYIRSRKYPNFVDFPPSIYLANDLYTSAYVRYSSLSMGAGTPGSVQIIDPFTSILGSNVDLYDYVIDTKYATGITIFWSYSVPDLEGFIEDQDGNFLGNIFSDSTATLEFSTPFVKEAFSLIVYYL